MSIAGRAEQPDSRGALDALIDHLDREAACLRDLGAVLDAEAAALRRLDAEALQACAAAKDRLAEAQAALEPARRARLAAAAPDGAPVDGLSALRVRLAPADAARLAPVHERLRELAEAVAARHRRNVAFTESARAVLGGALRSAARARAAADAGAVYGADGHVHANTGGAAVRERG